MDWSELRNWNEYFKLLVGLFTIVRPVAAIPNFLGIVSGLSEVEKQRVVSVTSITVLFTLLLCTFFGQQILDLFSISLPTLRIAGGLLLLLQAFDMLRSQANTDAPLASKVTENATAVAIAPLAIPILAGPGAISTVIVYAGLHETFAHKLVVGIVVITITVLVFMILRLALRMGAFLGPTGLTVLDRIAGLLLAALSIEMILAGLVERLPGLGAAIP